MELELELGMHGTSIVVTALVVNALIVIDVLVVVVVACSYPSSCFAF